MSSMNILTIICLFEEASSLSEKPFGTVDEYWSKAMGSALAITRPAE